MSPVKLRFSACLAAAAAASFVFAADPGQLSGVANFRDVGGYKAQDGLRLRSRTIYRSGELSGATAGDQQTLQSLQIRYEIDLRTDQERRESPSRWGAKAPEVISISLGMPRNADPLHSLGDLSEVRTAAQARSYIQQATAQVAVNGAADIGQVMGLLAQGDEPALIHCSAGKDRTGVTVAVLMTLLGIPREQVLREYTKSNDAAEQQLERSKAREQSGAQSLRLTNMAPEALKVMMGAEASNLETAFQAIDKQYGSFDGYVKNGLKITPEQIQSLRARLLER